MSLNINAKQLSISFGADKDFISSKPWGYDVDFGIVHSCGCAICRNYMLHVSAEAGADSYAQAILERDAELRNRFFEGFRRGRTAQLEHDTEQLKACRSERNVAREQVSVYEIKINEAERDILQLKDELLALRIAYNEVVSDNNNNTSSDDGSSVPDTDDDGHDDYGYSDLSDGIWEGDSTAVENDTTEDEDTSELPGPCHCPVTEPTDNLPVLSPPTVAEDLDAEVETTSQSSLQPVCGTTLPLPPGSPTTTSAVDEIRKKMRLAHLPDQGRILAEIKGLVSKAHKTQNSQRTEVQRVLMLEWRRPSPAVAYQSPTPPPVATPSEPEEIDVYVDASGTGIGFYLLGRWQAWKLKEGWRSVKCRDIQWAEAVAVEMGIRLLLKAGYMKTKIRLHSDNQQVVDALSTEDINRAEIGPTVQHYTNLCCLHGLECTVKWIPGAVNPADAPSRFLLLDENKRFPCDVKIPPHLQEFLLPYCLSE